MGRDKAKDDREFNCHQNSELNYVSGLYKERIIVKLFLVEKCNSKLIKNFTHMEVYKLIELKLGYAIPIH